MNDDLIENYFGISTPLIIFDGRMESDLRWNEGVEEIQRRFQANEKSLIQLDLGLFSSLTLPFDDEMQFSALQLSINHLKERLLIPLREAIIGVSLYSGPLNFSDRFPFHGERKLFFDQFCIQREVYTEKEREIAKQLFCQTAASSYLELLAASFEDSLPLYLFLDEARSMEEEIIALHTAFFPSYQLIRRKPLLAHGRRGVGMEGWAGSLPKVGILLPTSHSLSSRVLTIILESITILEKRELSYRLLTEERVTMEWEELETIYYFSHEIDRETRRKLMGFEAAQGRLLDVNETLLDS